MNTTIEYAKAQDAQDVLKTYRNQFYIPKIHGQEAIYMTGNSLGLLPKTTESYIKQELDDWANLGVEGHLEAKNPWLYYHHFSKEGLSHLLGASKEEVVAMNSLTTNLHLLLLSFYRPTAQRYKIVMEAGAFPSDQYLVETQVRLHGYDPAQAIIEVSASEGFYITMADIQNACAGQESEIALFLFSGVQYYTGQYFQIKEITDYAHSLGAKAGFDLAHAVGNIPLQLHDWQVDFAAWCSYKYLNTGPGSVGGAFVHSNNTQNMDMPILGGWWGVDEKTRFEMRKGFQPVHAVDAWQHSNAPVLSMAAHRASLDIFLQAGIQNLRAKALTLTQYLHDLLQTIAQPTFQIITPDIQAERGCQLSLLFISNGKKTHEKLTEMGVISDWRYHNLASEGEGVIRVAPVPLYNTYEDAWHVYDIIRSLH